jgi:uncharacterized double-CXXCG motif protein
MSVQRPHLLKPDDEIWSRFKYEIDGAHEIGLPGMGCPRCVAWSMVGSEYPTIAPKDLPLPLRRAARNSGVMPLEEWQSLRSAVGATLPADAPWGPGTEFGTLIADASGNLPDVAWLGRWTCLLRQGAYEQLLNEGFGLRGRSPKLKWKGGTPAKLVEVEVRPGVKLHGWRKHKPCDICGRVELSAPDTIVLDRKTYDPEIPLQRIVNLQTYIVVSPAMKNAIERISLSGVTFPALEWE